MLLYGAMARRALAEYRHPDDKLVVGSIVLDGRYIEAKLDPRICTGRADRGNSVGEALHLDRLGEKLRERSVVVGEATRGGITRLPPAGPLTATQVKSDWLNWNMISLLTS